ncbi:MAG: DUF554 domain-containing protein, partial [Oscillospiraceae bacterium]|nr:DUF554 domain-containing protein [Oscillospiraceae bacterium]
GGAAGLLVKKGLSEELSSTCMKIMGLCTVFIGLSGALKYMLVIGEDGALDTYGGLLLIISLVTGTLAGELLRLEQRFESFSSGLERRFGMDGFARGFVTASLLFCVGAMAIVGSFNDGLYGDHSILFIKSLMDGISALFLAASLGAGVLFASLAVLVYQGALTLSAGLIAPLLSEAAMADMCMVGYALIVVIGTNVMGLTKMRATNMLPSLAAVLLVRLLPFL